MIRARRALSLTQARSAATFVLIIALAVAVALGVTAAIVASQGKPAGEAVKALYDGAFGSVFAIGDTMNKAGALLLVALAFIVAKRAGLISIGGEGQIYMGGLTAVATALAVDGMPAWIAIFAAVVAGALGGAAWGALAGWLRAQFGVNVVISTLLLNFIAIDIVSWMVQDPGLLREPVTSTVSFPQSRQIPASVRLPHLFPHTDSPAQFGVVIALVMVPVVVFLLGRTVLGYRIRMLGHNPAMAARSGVRVRGLTVAVMAISGAIAGLAGVGLMLGEQYRLQENFSPGFGFDGIAVALVALDSPIGAVPAALLFGALRAGGALIEARVQVSQAIVLVVQGVIIVSAASVVARLRRRAARRSAGPADDAGAPGGTVVVPDPAEVTT